MRPQFGTSKTVIAPRKTTILWTDLARRNFSASPHRTATLAFCERPTKVKAMRSLILALANDPILKFHRLQ